MRALHIRAIAIRPRMLAAAIFAVCPTGASVTASAADTIEVVLDQAKVLQLPPNTQTVIVGNPVIADITMLKHTNQMVLTGKGYGETNMIALDAEGNAIGESLVRVSHQSRARRSTRHEPGNLFPARRAASRP